MTFELTPISLQHWRAALLQFANYLKDLKVDSYLSQDNGNPGHQNKPGIRSIFVSSRSIVDGRSLSGSSTFPSNLATLSSIRNVASAVGSSPQLDFHGTHLTASSIEGTSAYFAPIRPPISEQWQAMVSGMPN